MRARRYEPCLELVVAQAIWLLIPDRSNSAPLMSEGYLKRAVRLVQVSGGATSVKEIVKWLIEAVVWVSLSCLFLSVIHVIRCK